MYIVLKEIVCRIWTNKEGLEDTGIQNNNHQASNKCLHCISAEDKGASKRISAWVHTHDSMVTRNTPVHSYIVDVDTPYEETS